MITHTNRLVRICKVSELAKDWSAKSLLAAAKLNEVVYQGFIVNELEVGCPVMLINPDLPEGKIFMLPSISMISGSLAYAEFWSGRFKYKMQEVKP